MAAKQKLYIVMTVYDGIELTDEEYYRECLKRHSTIEEARASVHKLRTSQNRVPPKKLPKGLI